MSELLNTLIAAVIVLAVGWFARGRKEKWDKEKKLEKAHAARAEAEREAESQDDPALVDRLTRRD